MVLPCSFSRSWSDNLPVRYWPCAERKKDSAAPRSWKQQESQKSDEKQKFRQEHQQEHTHFPYHHAHAFKNHHRRKPHATASLQLAPRQTRTRTDIQTRLSLPSPRQPPFSNSISSSFVLYFVEPPSRTQQILSKPRHALLRKDLYDFKLFLESDTQSKLSRTINKRERKKSKWKDVTNGLCEARLDNKEGKLHG